MYSIIENHIEQIIHGKIDEKYCKQYRTITEKLHGIDVRNDSEYQRTYKNFWTMNPWLNKKFCVSYFTKLEQYKNNKKDINLESLLRDLYKIPVNNKGTRALQFSFVTKLIHVIDNNKPIYDNKIGDFYFIRITDNNDIDERIESGIRIYRFLEKEYKRILRKKLLEKSLDHIDKIVRKHSQGCTFSKVKLIDAIIWAFVSKISKKMDFRETVKYE